MSKKVLVPSFMPEAASQILENNGFTVIKGKMATTESLLEEAQGVAAIIATTTPIGTTVFEALPDLEIVARFGVGYDNVDLEAAKKAGIIVTNTPGANATSVAELTLTLILNLLNQAANYNAALKDGNSSFLKNAPIGVELANKSVGLVGYGHIAREVEQRLHAFNTKILISNRTKRDFKYGDYVSLDELLEQSDVISIHVPDTPDTHHLVDTKFLKKMKKTAYIVNTARGGVIDETALIDALEAGEIAGAGLDVFEIEPIEKNNKLRQLPNTILTPHVGARTAEASMNMATMAVEEVLRVLTGKKPTSQVN